MTIKEYARKEHQKMMASTSAVDPAIIEKFKWEMTEDYQKYEIENQFRIIQTRQLSDRTIIV